MHTSRLMLVSPRCFFPDTRPHSYSLEALRVVAVATALSAFYYDHRRHSRKARCQCKAIRALQSTFRALTDAPADMQLVATASAGLIPASVVLQGRAAVLDWVERASREAGAWRGCKC
jgi:hypothetical protein